MAINPFIPINDDDPRNQYVSTTSQTVFDYTFAIFSSDELVVVETDTSENDIIRTEGLGADQYVVTGVNDPDGGKITFNSGRVAGRRFTIYRDIPVERVTNFAIRGGFTSDRINLELDKIIMILQQQASQLNNRTIQQSVIDGDAQLLLPRKALRLNKYLFSDASGNIIPVAGTDAANPPSAAMLPVIQSPTVAGALHLMGGLTAAEIAAIYETSADHASSLAAALAALSTTYAPIASPTFTGTPQAPTPSAGDVTQKLATMANFAQGANGSSMVLLGTATASNSASISFTNIPATYDQYVLLVTNALPATNGAIFCVRVSEDNGSTWKTTNYYWAAYVTTVLNGSGVGGGNLTNQMQPAGGGTVTNIIGNGGISCVINGYNIGTPNSVKTFNSHCVFADSSVSNSPSQAISSMSYSGDTGAVNALQCFFSTGNITSGKFSLYGIRNS